VTVIRSTLLAVELHSEHLHPHCYNKPSRTPLPSQSENYYLPVETSAATLRFFVAALRYQFNQLAEISSASTSLLIRAPAQNSFPAPPRT